ncbi:hypothetical protein B0A48_01566 [Cryoendolithus antarcticus]|uniref:Small ribosomal subunit protein uS7m n=1 Tax=Cryoendolithus antarcticus TaxID=1507870 RepID=A0A1V8TQ16_9PEZI|nr:hypothetical protein B0A48_01566 [Cryoendolithus antarcticus]
MPPFNPFSALRTLPIRARPSFPVRQHLQRQPLQRSFADQVATNNPNALPKAASQTGGAPNENQEDHVSEEAAKMAKATGGSGPDLDVGTPVQEILAEEKDTLKTAPQVMKDTIKDPQTKENAKPSSGTRQFSTMARRMQGEMGMGSEAAGLDGSMIPSTEQRAVFAEEQFNTAITPTVLQNLPLPALPIPARSQQEHRYDPVVEQVTNLLMVDGKKAAAQRNMAHILSVLRTAPAPTYNPVRNLLPGAPPASHLPLNPVLYLTLAIDSIAPLLRIRSQRGAAGGGVALQIPVPLGLRQRRRQAMMWILDAVEKKKSRSSGRNTFAQRVAEELIGVVEGKSGVWVKRDAVHKLATTARSNLNFGSKGRR